MYTLEVFYDGSAPPHPVERIDTSAQVLSRIPRLLGQHRACEKIVVRLGAARLFAVDCKGNRLDD